MLTEPEFKEWLLHPATEAILAYINAQVADLKTRWSEGEFSAAFTTEMIVKNAAATGAVSAYLKIVEIEYEQLSDPEYLRPETPRRSRAGGEPSTRAEGG